jgi:hypothetical protein
MVRMPFPHTTYQHLCEWRKLKVCGKARYKHKLKLAMIILITGINEKGNKF